MSRVVIFIEHGCVSEVISEDELEIMVVDRDTDGVIGAEQAILGRPAVLSLWNTDPNNDDAQTIEQAFSELEVSYADINP